MRTGTIDHNSMVCFTDYTMYKKGINGTVYLLNLDQNITLELSASTDIILNILHKPVSIKDILLNLKTNYLGDLGSIEKETLDFLNELYDRKFIVKYEVS